MFLNSPSPVQFFWPMSQAAINPAQVQKEKNARFEKPIRAALTTHVAAVLTFQIHYWDAALSK